MVIAIDGTALFGAYGGVQYALWNLMAAMARQATDVHFHVLIPRNGPSLAMTAPLGPHWRWHRLPFTGQQRLRRILWQQLQLPAWCRQAGVDLLHAPTYVAPLRTSVPTVLTIYDLIALTHPEFAATGNRWHYRGIMPRAIGAARRIMVPTTAVAQELGSHFPAAAARLRVVPLGVEPEFYLRSTEAELEAVRRRYQLPERYLLYVGNFEPKKNIQAMMAMMDQVPEAPPLVLAGGNRPWGEVLHRNQRVHLTGYIRRKDLPALYQMASVFLFPSFHEGFGLPVLEALAVGVPVIAGQVPLPDLEQVARVIRPPAPPALAAALRELLGHPEACRALRHAGPTYARPYSWDQSARLTLEVYREAL